MADEGRAELLAEFKKFNMDTAGLEDASINKLMASWTSFYNQLNTSIPQAIDASNQALQELKNKQDAVKAAKEEAAKKALEQVSAEAEKSAKKLAELEEKYKSMISSAEREKQEAADRLAAVEKSAKVAANPDVLKFSFYFEEAQKNIGKMKDILATVDGETAEKLKKAMAAVAAQLTNN